MENYGQLSAFPCDKYFLAKDLYKNISAIHETVI